MKLIQETEDAMNNRKLIKSQVEKRRRERMNHSLERLRTMLLQQPPRLGEAAHRMEKSEILEQTVLFLQNAAKANNTRAGAARQKSSIQEGFSACLQRAVQFLGPEGKGLRLGAALDASLAARFASSDSESAGACRGTEAQSSSSVPCTMSILRALRPKSKHRSRACDFGVNSFAHPYKLPVQQVSRVPQRSQRQLEISMETRADKPSESLPGSQALWRPWP